MTETKKPNLDFDRWMKKASRWLEAGQEVAEVLVQVGKSPSPLGMAAAGISLLKGAQKARLMTYYDYLEYYDFNRRALPGLGDFWSGHRLENLGESTIPSCVESDAIRIVEVGGVQFAFEVVKGHYEDGPFVQQGHDEDTCRRVMADAIWAKFDSSPVVIKTVRSASGHHRGDITLLPDSHSDILESERAKRVLDRVQRRLGSSPSTSILVAGEPGTGKSSLIRWVASQLGGRQIRIPAQVLSNSNAWLPLVNLLRPSTLVVDDLDHSTGDVSNLLTNLEELRDFVKVIMASANEVKELHPAVVRPGRFDEIYTPEGADPSVVEKLIVGLDSDTKDRLLKLPIAYVVEYKKRRAITDPAYWNDELLDLEKRASVAS